MRSAIVGAATVLTSMVAASQAAINFTFLPISDSGGAHSAYYNAVISAITVAGDQWTQYLPQSGNLEIQISFIDGISTISGTAVTFGSPGKIGGIDIFQTGPAYELNGYGDPTGNGADIKFDIGADVLSQLWFDPDPSNRTDLVPGSSYDAISSFMQGFGRAFGYFSYRNGDGSLTPGQTYESSFDLNVTSVGGLPFFNGSNATAVYGGPVPLTNGTVYLLGNTSGPGADLSGDLMNGIGGIELGTRYFVSNLDLAILTDSGLQTVPEPATVVLFALSGLAFVLARPMRLRLRR